MDNSFEVVAHGESRCPVHRQSPIFCRGRRGEVEVVIRRDDSRHAVNSRQLSDRIVERVRSRRRFTDGIRYKLVDIDPKPVLEAAEVHIWAFEFSLRRRMSDKIANRLSQQPEVRKPGRFIP